MWLETQFIFSPIFSHSADVLEAYIKTDGAWIVKLPKSQYTAKTVEDCAIKCNKETSFTCRSKSDHNKTLKTYSAVLDSTSEALFQCIMIIHLYICALQVLFIHRKRSGLCNITCQFKNWSNTAKNECCPLWEKG